jgi:hypothetical protein
VRGAATGPPHAIGNPNGDKHMTLDQILNAAADRYVQRPHAKYEYSWHVSDPDDDPGAQITMLAHMPHGLSYYGHYDVAETADGRIEMVWSSDTCDCDPEIVDRTVDAVLAQLNDIQIPDKE